MANRAFWHNHLRPFLVFSKGERNGVIFLFLLLNLAWIIPVYLPRKQGTLGPTEMVLIDSANRRWKTQEAERKRYRVPENPHQRDSAFAAVESPAKRLFRPFDPNTADEQTWAAMGIPDRTIRIIHRYVAKGGRFRAPDDLRKIYGLTDQQYRSLRAWIRIAPPTNSYPGPVSGFSKSAYHDSDRGRPAGSYAHDRTRGALVRLDINLADSTAWESLPGIGPTLASRIIRYREALGGFHSVEQLAETYGLRDSVFRQIRVRLFIGNGHQIEPLRLNSADAPALAMHPYISRKLAGLITAYRSQHGPFTTPEDLLAIPLVNDSLLNRLRPYLSFD